ncbi:MAG: flagellar protein FlaG [Candidatus Tectomicrobia bacterium]|uniref:Flagellar protein FlaG n=1 Tax=Tectimicrobiota bacterium TaxID=2528274 RepID=A0A932MNP1_UNCTE|nr:flagellar protein FlaG [Candidatus Tectomicrobia bacterium]
MIEGNVIAPVASGEPRPAPTVVAPLSTGGGPQAGPPVQQNPAPPVQISGTEAKALARELSERLDVNRFRVEVSVDEETRSFVFSIYHSGTGKLIRQFPPEGILFMAEQLKAASPSGVLLDEQV